MGVKKKASYKCTYPEMTSAQDVQFMAPLIKEFTNRNSPLYVPPRHVADDSDVEAVLANTLDRMAFVMTEGATALRDVLTRRYISVEDALKLAEERGAPVKRRPKAKQPIGVEVVRAAFARLVALSYASAVALLDAYSCMHFNELKPEDFDNFNKALKEELKDYDG